MCESDGRCVFATTQTHVAGAFVIQQRIAHACLEITRYEGTQPSASRIFQIYLQLITAWSSPPLTHT